MIFNISCQVSRFFIGQQWFSAGISLLPQLFQVGRFFIGQQWFSAVHLNPLNLHPPRVCRLVQCRLNGMNKHYKHYKTECKPALTSQFGSCWSSQDNGDGQWQYDSPREPASRERWIRALKGCRPSFLFPAHSCQRCSLTYPCPHWKTLHSILQKHLQTVVLTNWHTEG